MVGSALGSRARQAWWWMRAKEKGSGSQKATVTFGRRTITTRHSGGAVHDPRPAKDWPFPYQTVLIAANDSPRWWDYAQLSRPLGGQAGFSVSHCAISCLDQLWIRSEETSVCHRPALVRSLSAARTGLFHEV